ncbi:disease resistance protein RGA5-like [Phragmites australis]|uniref:disease resistance protein RGA5-like n=1 Tax=Phragmites australis TaxID=29695 RepID=UPI002D76A8B1|nr:disease resistance protein RGA5-like [Phragmites australis]XP_062200748.1 disease resistance protein RGA5-like [Phragmites australis]
MKGAMVSVATGVMNSLLDKLTTLLGKEFSWLHNEVKHDIAFLRDELSCMNALLEKLTDMEVLDPQMKEWRNQVREMAYDIEDCIDDSFMHQQRPGGIMGFFHDYVQKVKELLGHHGIAQQIKELKGRIVEASHRRKRYKLDTQVDPGTTNVLSIDPRLPALYVESSELIGIDVPRDHLINLLGDGEQSLKVISIVGLGGLGKTTLANEAYKRISGQFNCQAFVSVSQKPDVNKILRSILSQIKNRDKANTEPKDVEWLIDALRDLLKDKRYFIVIDDIWDTQAWKTIKCGLPGNTCGSRILVTTRIATIAKSCCSPHHGTVYELRPLSEADSMSLFFKRIFGSEDLCPANLKDVAVEIIKKCGGLPLAIVTMASLMSTKSVRREEWVSVCNSIGLGLQSYNVEGMERILSLSYCDLPYHLKTCLLYLSMYPEDHEIDMCQLVRRWIAEGFIKAKSGRNSVDEGKCYFNELINRSLIQPVGFGLDGQATACRVHDMILDLIVSKAVEENFISSVGDQMHTLISQGKVRRLSVDYRGQEVAMSRSSMISSHVRSLGIFGYSEKMLPISNFRALRMLDLESSARLQNCYLHNIGDLFQLRYLRVAASGVTHLPEQIGELQFLETLDLCRTWIRKLPPSIVKLQRLNFLSVNGSQLPDGVGNMQSLEELSGLSVYNECSINSLQELGSLMNLRTLRLTWHISDSRNDRTAYTDILASSLGKLVGSSLRCLRIIRGHGSVDIPFDSWPSPPHLLRELDIPGCCFQMIPEWMASMANLSTLHLRVKQVTQEILHVLGDLRALLDLELRSEAADGPMEMLVVCNNRFRCLKIFRLYGQIMGLIFEAGATPQLERFSIEIRARQAQSAFADHPDLGIHHLTSLRDLNVWIDCEGARIEEVEMLEAAITDATNLLPNHPTPRLYRV